jgi:hypothetical protein
VLLWRLLVLPFFVQLEKKSMAFFSRDRGKVVPKAVPPDKSVGAWPSVQEKTTGAENVGKFPRGRTNDDHPGVNEQENCEKHHDIPQQEDIPCVSAADVWLQQALTRMNERWDETHQALLKQHHEFFEGPGKEVPKAVPKDKSVGAWPSVQEKTTGTENVRKSLCGGTTDDHQGVNEQEKCRKHHDTPQQEDTPGKVSSRTIMTSLEHIEFLAQREERFQERMDQQHTEHLEVMKQLQQQQQQEQMTNMMTAMFAMMGPMMTQASLNQRQAQWEESEREREKSAYTAEKVRNWVTDRDIDRMNRLKMFSQSLSSQQDKRIAAVVLKRKTERRAALILLVQLSKYERETKEAEDLREMARRETKRKEEETTKRELAYERARILWISSIWAKQKEKEEKVMRREARDSHRRAEQRESFTWKVPVKVSGLKRSIQYNGKMGLVLRWLKDKGKFQVQLEDGILLAVAPENAIRQETKGAEGKEGGNKRKEKRKEKMRRRKVSRLKRARVYWENRFQTQATPCTSKHRKPTGYVKAPKTVQLSTTSVKSSRAGKTPNHRDRGVMSLRTISTKRTRSLMTLGINISQERQSGDNAEQGNAAKRNDDKKTKKQFGGKGWGDCSFLSNQKSKRKILKGSTDVLLIKRTIELEID